MEDGIIKSLMIRSCSLQNINANVLSVAPPENKNIGFVIHSVKIPSAYTADEINSNLPAYG